VIAQTTLNEEALKALRDALSKLLSEQRSEQKDVMFGVQFM